LFENTGLPANLISMGALDFGLLLEGTLVIVETVFVSWKKRLIGSGRNALIKSPN
jgi:cobalt-zinc-cadmium resistance protein CzcA